MSDILEIITGTKDETNSFSDAEILSGVVKRQAYELMENLATYALMMKRTLQIMAFNYAVIDSKEIWKGQSPDWEMYEELYSLLDQVIKKAVEEEEEVTSG